MSERTNRLKKNTFLVFLGSIGAKLVSFLMLPLYTKWLSVEEYGLADILTVYVTFLLSIVTCCISESIFVFPKGEEQTKQKKYYSSSMIFLLIILSITALLFFITDIISNTCGINNSFTDNIWLIYFMLLSEIIMKVSQQFARSIDKMEVYSITGIINALSMALFGFIIIPLYGVAGYVWSMIGAHLVAGLYAFFFSKSYIYLGLNFFHKASLLQMLRYSIPLIPNSVMWWIVHAINRPIMEMNLGLHDIGLYAVANKFPSVINMFFGVFTTAWQISVLEEFKKDGYSLFFNKFFRLIFVVLTVILVFMIIFSKLLVDLFIDESYVEAWKFIPILCLGSFFACISGIIGTHFSATKESKYYFYSSIWGAIVAISLNILLIPSFKLYGACFAVVISFLTMSGSRIMYCWKYIQIKNLRFYILLLMFITILIYAYITELNTILLYTYALVFLGLIIYFNKNIISYAAQELKRSIYKRKQ